MSLDGSNSPTNLLDQNKTKDGDNITPITFDRDVKILKSQALKGSLDSALALFYRYTYSGDYQRAFFWANLCEKNGYQSDKEDLESISRSNIKIQIREVRALEIKALEGSLEAARELFSRFTYHDRDYERSFFWAILCKELGYQSDKGDLEEIARNNVELQFFSDVE